VGVLCKHKGKFAIVEYSEVSDQIRNARDKTTGRLLYDAGNICNHYFHMDFLRLVCTQYAVCLPYGWVA
jgi:UDP-N-acetylglucosamine/UDP-N-acetylgalactosamine diphosphorylase